MGKSSSTNRPVIAGRRLKWDGSVKRCHLLDENGKKLYEVKRLYGKDGRALHDPETGFGFRYQVTDLKTNEVLGTDTYLSCAKWIAEEDFMEKHKGRREGYWTSERLTKEKAKRLGEVG
jgi:hypothetical protein